MGLVLGFMLQESNKNSIVHQIRRRYSRKYIYGEKRVFMRVKSQISKEIWAPVVEGNGEYFSVGMCYIWKGAYFPLNCKLIFEFFFWQVVVEKESRNQLNLESRSDPNYVEYITYRIEKFIHMEKSGRKSRVTFQTLFPIKKKTWIWLNTGLYSS